MTYEAHNALIDEHRDDTRLWVLILGIVLTVVVTIIWTVAVMLTVYFVAGREAGPEWLDRLLYAQTPTSTLLLLSTIWGIALGTFAAARFVHGRSIASLFGPLRRLRQHFLVAALVAFGIFALTFLIPYGPTPLPNTGFGLWINFLPISLLVVFAQTGAEEVFFRGYLQHQLAARFNSPIVWMVLPSMIFGAMHCDPNLDPVTMVLIIAATTVFGICAADLTAMTGSIGAAWGFHFANNVLAILVMSLDDRLSGLALYVLPISIQDTADLAPLLLLDIGITVCVWFAIRTALRRLS